VKNHGSAALVYFFSFHCLDDIFVRGKDTFTAHITQEKNIAGGVYAGEVEITAGKGGNSGVQGSG
jgi:hypothetical protein